MFLWSEFSPHINFNFFCNVCVLQICNMDFYIAWFFGKIFRAQVRRFLENRVKITAPSPYKKNYDQRQLVLRAL